MGCCATPRIVNQVRSSVLALTSLALLFGLSCSILNRTSDDNEITVAAASSFTDAFEEMGRQFTSRTGVRVVFSFGASADLAKQIENGAPFDAFLSADEQHQRTLDQKQLLTPNSTFVFARGQLVLWIPTGSRLHVEKLDDLKRADVQRIAIAKPDVAPYGKATVEALTAVKLWNDLQPKVIYGQNVSQVKQYAETGNVDVAFIPRSLVREGEGRMIAIDQSLHSPLNQSMSIVRASMKQENARRFGEFISSGDGQAILQRFGYLLGEK